MEKRKNFIINFLYYAIIIGIAFYVIRFAFGYMMPFIIGFLIATLLKPIINFITAKTGHHRLVSVVVILVFYAVFGFILSLLSVRIVVAVRQFAEYLPSFYNTVLEPTMQSLWASFQQLLEANDPAIAEIINQIVTGLLDSLEGAIGTVSRVLITWITSLATSVPSFLISVLITIIASFFFVIDYKMIMANVRFVPRRQRELLFDIKADLISILGKYAKAYAILMSATFVQLSIGFLILRINNPIGVAALIAAIDILPVLGTGSVVIPWIVYELVIANYTFGFSLLILYLIITVVRNILEPKIVGDQIGLHPLVTLVCVFVGLRLFGVGGMFGLPIVVTIMKSLHDQGKIDFFNKISQKTDSST